MRTLIILIVHKYSEVDEDEDKDEDEGRKEREKPKFPRCLANTPDANVELHVRMTVICKRQFRHALDHYRFMKGYHIKVINSDRKRCQTICRAENCKRMIWASPTIGEDSYQIKISNAHSCLPSNFEQGRNR